MTFNSLFILTTLTICLTQLKEPWVCIEIIKRTGARLSITFRRHQEHIARAINLACEVGGKSDKRAQVAGISALGASHHFFVFVNKEDWRKIVDNAMTQDFSWKNIALRYVDLYKEL